MKKIIRAIFALLVIGVFILVTQISCQKSNAQASGNSSAISPGLILFGSTVSSRITIPADSGRTQTVTINSCQYSLTDINGGNMRQIPIVMPAGLYVTNGGHLTNDGKILVFPANSTSNSQIMLYSCFVDGSNLKRIADISANNPFFQDVH